KHLACNTGNTSFSKLTAFGSPSANTRGERNTNVRRAERKRDIIGSGGESANIPNGDATNPPLPPLPKVCRGTHTRSEPPCLPRVRVLLFLQSNRVSGGVRVRFRWAGTIPAEGEGASEGVV